MKRSTYTDKFKAEAVKQITEIVTFWQAYPTDNIQQLSDQQVYQY